MTAHLLIAQLQGLDAACGAEDPSRVCSKIYEWTDNETLAAIGEWLINRPLRIVLIIVGALILSRVLRHAIDRLSDRIRHTPKDPRLAQFRKLTGGQANGGENGIAGRAPARAEAIEAVLKSIVSVVVWVLAVLLVLGELNINLAPLIAGAGIAGIALGFGAQSMVRDFLAGIFILVEDQYGVGDVIEVGPVTGTVENISLRSTRVRDVEGTVWHLANGDLNQVGNHSQLWSNCVIDVDVAYETDLRKAMHLLDQVADDMWQETVADDSEIDMIIADPVVQGVQALGESAITLRLVVKTDPASQWQVQRELRLRIKEAFDANGISIPFPQRSVRVVTSGAPFEVEPEAPGPSPATSTPPDTTPGP